MRYLIITEYSNGAFLVIEAKSEEEAKEGVAEFRRVGVCKEVFYVRYDELRKMG